MHPQVENAGAPAPEPAAPGVGEDAARGGVPGPSAPAPSDDAAWAEVVAAWGDEARHLAYLARVSDLEGLAVAGGRYRAVLEERPADPIALRFRDEVVRRATVHGLAAFGGTPPDVARGRRLVRALAIVLVVGLAVGTLLAARDLAALLGARP